MCTSYIPHSHKLQWCAGTHYVMFTHYTICSTHIFTHTLTRQHSYSCALITHQTMFQFTQEDCQVCLYARAMPLMISQRETDPPVENPCQNEIGAVLPFFSSLFYYCSFLMVFYFHMLCKTLIKLCGQKQSK